MNPGQFEYIHHLIDIFPNRTQEDIESAIEVVHYQTPDDSVDAKLDNIINLLADNSNDDCAPFVDEATNNLFDLNFLDDSNIDQILNIFPDACPEYVRNMCLKLGHGSLDAILDAMTAVDYPKKEVNPQQMLEQLKDMLPNADPTFLEKHANALAFQAEADLKKFIEDVIENDDYPTMADYLKNKKENEEIYMYTYNFDIKKFLKRFPDPEKHFSDPNRKSLTPSSDTDEEIAKEEELYALTFLYNYYGYLRKKDIKKVFEMYSRNLLKTCNRLDTMRKAMTVPRSVVVIENFPKNIPLLQEIAYLKHRKQIRRILKEYDIEYRKSKEQARLHGLLQTCGCCFDNELIPEECYFCKKGCIFCKECVKNGAENIIGDGKLNFSCLAECDAEFSISTLQMVLDSVVFSRMAQRKQMEEIKRANLDGLESCPFCEFSTIPSPDDKIFHCLNNDCLKESCRECRHEAHLPLRCSEIEYDEDVRMRTYIENKMTEALLRKCWKCSKVFIKESGCNKMTCSCGASICYICNAAITEYTHFGENRCPLYTSDLNKFHVDAVIRGANIAKAELGVDKNPDLLKIDPTVGLDGESPVTK